MNGRGVKGRETVAVILAIGIAVAVNLLMFAVLWDALRSDTPGLSENATQVVLAAFTGIIGVLGGYVGGRAVERQRDVTEHELVEQAHHAPPPEQPPP